MIFQQLFRRPDVVEVILQRVGYTNMSSMAGVMMSWMRHRFSVTR